MESLGKVISIPAGADLSSATEKFVVINSSGNVILPDAVTKLPVGILKNAPVTGEAAEVAINGTSRVWLGATLSPGDRVSTGATGKAVAAASGSYPMGILQKGGADGEIGEVIMGSQTVDA